MNKKFDLAIKLKKLNETIVLAGTIKNNENWKIAADLANELGEFRLAEECMWMAKDFSGLLFFYTW